MLEGVDLVLREALLFASVGLLIGGVDDLAIDLIWIARTGWKKLFVFRRYMPADAGTLPPPARPGRIAILVAAWHEAEVIGSMLRYALERLDHADYRIYVGTYPNDPATIAAVKELSDKDERVRLVIGDRPGPTTKGDNLNQVWQALVSDEQTSDHHYKAVVLHDAEDLVHAAELKVFDSLIERFDLVQLPVLPLPDQKSRWIAGHYCDEFAEAHHRQMVVREALGASIPSAGVGCAIARDAIEEMAGARNGRPFDEASLTEDYEIGLRLADKGREGVFVSIPATVGGEPVAVRAHFPGKLGDAVRQKTRWMVGIALMGWDRLGWRGHWAEYWMRLRDRRTLLAAVVLTVAYAAMLLWLVSIIGHSLNGSRPAPLPRGLDILLQANFLLLIWRGTMRYVSVRRHYGRTEALLAICRIVVSNAIAMLAARRAVVQYWRLLRGKPLSWDKTQHQFPSASWR